MGLFETLDYQILILDLSGKKVFVGLWLGIFTAFLSNVNLADQSLPEPTVVKINTLMKETKDNVLTPLTNILINNEHVSPLS